jgi:integrase
VPAFGPFATDLTADREGQVAEETTKHEKWALGHLVPFFGDWAINEIDVEGVDDYRAFKVKESEARARAIERGKPKRNAHGQILRPLSAGSINRTIDHLQWVLSIAIEYRRFGIAENATEGKRRRLRESRPAPVYIDSAAQVEALLEAAAELDRDPHYELAEREAILATFLFAGPRAHELCNLLWRDIDLAGARVFIGRSKTAAGLREIKIDELLEGRGLVLLPRGLTTHKLRHAFASILVALGEDPISVMRQIGHTDPQFTLRVYTHMMSLDGADRERLKALVRGERVIARKAPPPKPVDLAEYEAPIVAALAERGGRGPRREILAAVEEAMAHRHGALDLEQLPSGEPRWQPRPGKARARLVKRGWLEATAWRGNWELTERAGTRRAVTGCGAISQEQMPGSKPPRPSWWWLHDPRRRRRCGPWSPSRLVPWRRAAASGWPRPRPGGPSRVRADG